MKIREILQKDFIITELSSDNKAAVFLELCQFLEQHGAIKDRATLLSSLLAREELCSTGIGENVAIPHAKTDQTEQIVALFGRSAKGIEFESLDKKPVHFICLLLAPLSCVGQHLKALAQIARLFKNQHLRNQILNAKNAEEIYSSLLEEDSKFI